MELPPRTRRIPGGGVSGAVAWGTTSAHAENTPPVMSLTVWVLELPPRTRRIHFFIENPIAGNGTTSAHAENTPSLY